MSFLDEFGDMATTPISVAVPSTADRNVFGVLAASTGTTTYLAHVQEVNGANRRLTGMDDYCSSIAWIGSTSTGNMGRDAVFTFPDGSHPPALSVTYPRDENGDVHHTKVVFG